MNKKIKIKNSHFKKKFEIKKNLKGDVFKILDKKSKNYFGFGELYITSLKKGTTKGWNLHKKMVLNLIVIKGKVRFVMKKNNKINITTLSHNKKEILTIKSNVWIKMINLDSNTSEIINFANLKYNKNEILKSEIK